MLYLNVVIPSALSLVLSVITVIIVFKSSVITDETKRGMVTILFLVIGNLAWIFEWVLNLVVSGTVLNISDPGVGSIKLTSTLNFTAHTMIPCIIAFYNPFILCIRNTQIRNTVNGIRDKITEKYWAEELQDEVLTDVTEFN